MLVSRDSNSTPDNVQPVTEFAHTKGIRVLYVLYACTSLVGPRSVWADMPDSCPDGGAPHMAIADVEKADA